MEQPTENAVTQKPMVTNYRYYVLAVLLVIYCFNFIDRQILAVLSPQIKADLDLNDTQLGILKGLAFALFYAIMGIPLAIVGDRFNRVKLISFSVGLWSLMTALSGFANSFFHLLLARVGVGIGEAGGTPPSHSLISDYFERKQRATAMGIFSLGVPIGTLFGFLIGGWLASTYGWRTTFLLVGAPGILIAIILRFTVKEPKRGATEENPEKLNTVKKLVWYKLIASLWSIKSYRTTVYAGALNAFCGYGLSMWLMDFFFRNHGYTDAQALSVPLAIVIGIGGGIGTFSGGFFADFMGKKDKSYYLSIPGWSMLLCAPLVFLALWVPTAMTSFAILFVVFFCIYLTLGPIYGVVQTLAPVNNRALAVAFYFLCQSLIGAGLGPFLIGGASDILNSDAFGFNEGEALRVSMYMMVFAIAAAGIVLITQRKHLEVDLKTLAERAEAEEANK